MSPLGGAFEALSTVWRRLGNIFQKRFGHAVPTLTHPRSWKTRIFQTSSSQGALGSTLEAPSRSWKRPRDTLLTVNRPVHIGFLRWFLAAKAHMLLPSEFALGPLLPFRQARRLSTLLSIPGLALNQKHCFQSSGLVLRSAYMFYVHRQHLAGRICFRS